ncbi:hypothetical protein SteCoe_14103 [Stentor coeruleus]|uniref:Centromere protein J C-terminal domain-containing protein n=1 Tax=Stentor coeruleus TaxID=5963 RepID=A0A1R2C6R1_9CILI|nr:hypothetical protein SteCoe_14103 [Stentor coeruleus]
MEKDCFLDGKGPLKVSDLELEKIGHAIEDSPQPENTSFIEKDVGTFEELLGEGFQYTGKFSSPIEKPFLKSHSKATSSIFSLNSKPFHKESKSQKFINTDFTNTSQNFQISHYNQNSTKLSQYPNRTPQAKSISYNKYLELQEENLILKKQLSRQQDLLQRKDSILNQTIEGYEKRIRALENINHSLIQKMNQLKGQRFLKRTTRSFSPVSRDRKFHSHKASVYENLLESENPNEKKRQIVYPNGVKCEIYPNGYKVTYYTNRDIKQEYPDGKQVYFFASEQTTKITYPDGLKEITFRSGQKEKYFPDGTKEIKYTDGTLKCVFPGGDEQTVLPNGTIEKLDYRGIKTIMHKDGRKETIFYNFTKS